MNTAAIEIRDLHFSYRAECPLLDINRLQIGAGERIFLHGPSGSGKSTLLALIGGVLQPQRGSLAVFGKELSQLKPARRDALRADCLGFVFQVFNLIPYLSVPDNVMLPGRFSRTRMERAIARSGSAKAEAIHLLQALNVASDLGIATELSQGQQQRVAVARALFGQPKLLIADEPTSSLDADARERFLTLLLDECAQSSTTVLFVSHDSSLASRFDRAVSLREINTAARIETD